MAGSDAYVALEVTAWSDSKGGSMGGVHGVRTRARNLWNRLDAAPVNPLRVAFVRLRQSEDNVNRLTTAGIPATPDEDADANEVADYSRAASAVIAARLAFIQAIDTYNPIRVLHPRADLSARWLGQLRTTHDAQRAVEEAALADVVATVLRPDYELFATDGQDEDDDARRALGGLSSNWVAKGETGAGGLRSTVSLKTFVKLKDGLIIDRVVVKKETRVERRRFDTSWDSNTIPGRDLPTEITTMLRVRNRVGADKFVKLRNWRINDPATSQLGRPTAYAVYLEFCGYGDLTDKFMVDLAPEPFMWKVFEDLATACLVLERGDVEVGGATWEPIVHRDIKLDNVFLAAPGETFCRYPTAKLADFGTAMNVPANDQRPYNEMGHRTCGTRSVRPPEHLSDKLIGTAQLQRMSSLSNVWGIGIVLWSIAQNTNSDNDLELPDETGFHPDHLKPYDFNADAIMAYSDDLRDLIMECLEYLPRDRPTPDNVLRRVRAGIRIHGQGLRDAGSDNEAWETYPPGLPNEKWAMTGPPDDDSDEDLGGQAGTFMTF